MPSPKGVKVITLPPGCGYGDAGVEYVAGLDALGVPVTWRPAHWRGRWPVGKKLLRARLRPDICDRLMALRHRRIDYDTFLLIFPPPAMHPYWRRKERRCRAFTLATWETDILPPDWAPALNQYDGVFVPCAFNRDTFAAEGVTAPVDVVPHIARTARRANHGPPMGGVSDDDFVFYTIGTWIVRKAMEETVRAYLDTFTGNDEVALVIKTDAVDQVALSRTSRKALKQGHAYLGTTALSLARIMAGYDNPAKVHLIASELPPDQIDYLHSRGNCFLSLARSEGWGLGAFDAANYGKPVIITGWGGHLDYLGADYPYLVDYQLEPTNMAPDDGCFLHAPDARWARADQAHAGQLMRAVFKDRQKASGVAGALREKIRERYAADAVSRRLAELMGFRVKG